MSINIVSSSLNSFFEYSFTTWRYLVAKQDELILIQTIITIFAVFLAIYEIRRWKIQHIRERESNYYFDLLMKIEDLRFQILMMRTPKYLNPNKTELVEQEKNELIDEIKSSSFSIEKEIGIIEKISKSKSDFRKLYRTRIGEAIVRVMSIEAYTFTQADNKDKPSKSNVNTPNNTYGVDYTGLQVIQDEFFQKINTNFEVVISALSKKLI
jgi:hypothetical protein